MEREEREKEAIRQRALKAMSDMEGAQEGDLQAGPIPTVPVTTATHAAEQQKF